MKPDSPAIDPAAHVPVVRRALRSLGVAPEALDDAVQDVFTVVVRREADFDRERSLTNWLWGIARGVASTHRRSRERRARLLAALASTPVESVGFEEALARADATARIADFVAKLPANQRDVFVLAHLQGKSGPEIAAELGINLNTAYARVRTTRIRFEAELAPSEPTTLGARIMRAFAPMFAASSKSFATASLTASLVWVGASLPMPMHTEVATAAPIATSAVIAHAVPEPHAPRGARKARGPAKAPVMITSKIAQAALGATLLATPTVALAKPAKAAKPAPAATSDQDADENAKRGGAGGVSYYDFVEGDRAEGIVLKPEGTNVGANARRVFESLIRIRGHFMPELVRMAKDV